MALSRSKMWKYILEATKACCWVFKYRFSNLERKLTKRQFPLYSSLGLHDNIGSPAKDDSVLRL